MNTAFQPSGNEVKAEAFREHRRSGRMKSSQGAVIAALVFADGIAMTRNELAEVTGLPLSSVCGRCRELLDLGNIEVAGMTADKPARQKLQLTEKGRDLALAAAEGGGVVSAIISDCGQYRYLLTRPSEVELPECGTALFLMLNPSTADASLDDPTIRRCRGFAKSWGCAGLTVANLYALRATNPKELWRHDAPIGAENNYWLEKLAKEYGDVVCAWGANAKPERVNEVYQILKDAGARLWCLGTTKSGAPKHPLYIKADQKLIAWEPTDALA